MTNIVTSLEDPTPTPENDPALAEAAEPVEMTEVAPPAINWWAEVKGIFWLLVAVLAFHSFIAKPFYIPSESMMPNLLVGDRLVVSKLSYGWSHVSPTIPSPYALYKWLVLREETDSLAVKLPEWRGRFVGSMPERGDIVILTPPGRNQDYIKRVIGLPGDRIELRDGAVILNGVPIKRSPVTDRLVPIDTNAPCPASDYPGRQLIKADGSKWCRLPIVRETLPNGKSYDTIDLGPGYWADSYGPKEIPEGQLFLMGDNRDHSADSRFSAEANGLGGPVPWENIGGRALFITFSLDGRSTAWNPLSWFTALRGGRAMTSLAAEDAPKK